MRKWILLPITLLIGLISGPVLAHGEGVGPRGGQRAHAGPLHAELVTDGAAMTVYLYDMKDQAIPTQGATGSITAQIGGKTEKIDLQPADGNGLRGTLSTAELNGAKLVATLTLAGKGPVSARFEVHENADTAAVKAVLKSYQAAVSKLDLTGTQALFAPDSRIFEQGGDEGSYADYLQHHLIPELAEFSAFTYSDYRVTVRIEGPLAIASETYTYRITLKDKPETIERLGAATAVLIKRDGKWLIIQHHNSGRRPPGK